MSKNNSGQSICNGGNSENTQCNELKKNINKNIALNGKPDSNKRRDSDNKEIADFIKKNNDKKKIINQMPFKDPMKDKIKEPIKEHIREPIKEKIKELIKEPFKEPIKDVIKEPIKELIKDPIKRSPNSSNPIINKNVIITNIPIDDINPLKELMKKQRAELKNKPKEDVVWSVKEKDDIILPNKNKKEREIKFPNIIIVEKEKPTTINKEIVDTNNNSNCNRNKDTSIPNKESEEFYNLNRYLNEIAKITNEEVELENETEIESEENCNTNVNVQLNEDNMNDGLEIVDLADETVTDHRKTPNLQLLLENDTENTQIEELRIELENSLGFDLFKKVYQTVEENVLLLVLFK